MGARHVKGLEFSWAVGWQLAAPHRKGAVPLSSCRRESGFGSKQVLEKKEGFSVPTGLVTGSAGTVHT